MKKKRIAEEKKKRISVQSRKHKGGENRLIDGANRID